MKKIAILPADGIGPEVMQEAVKVLDAARTKFSLELAYEFADAGGYAFDKHRAVGTSQMGDAVVERIRG